MMHSILDNALSSHLDLSTGHVPGPEPDWGGHRVVAHEHGWIVFVSSVVDVKTPDWLKPIMNYAYKYGISLINFDSDAMLLDKQLKVYDW